MVTFLNLIDRPSTFLCFAFIPHSHLLHLSWPFRSLLIWGDYFVGRVARRPATTVDGGVLSRLLTPTQASLARSKSAAALSAEGKDAPGNLHVGDPDREERWQGSDPGTPCLP